MRKCWALAVWLASASAFGAECDDVIAKYPAFSGVALVMREGKVVCEQQAGEHNSSGARLKIDDPFLIASVTKQFTSAGIMLLAQREKLRLDAPLAQFFPGWDHRPGLTIRHLLSHRSGIADYTLAPAYTQLKGQVFSHVSPLLSLIRSLPADFAPDEKWAYSNSNFILLAAIIEKVSGQDWWAFLDQEIIRPLGLSHTRFVVDKSGALPEGHDLGEAGKSHVIAPELYLEPGWAHGSGGIESTVHDLARWNDGLFHSSTLGPEIAEEMAKVRSQVDERTGYGYGLARRIDVAEEVVFHPGNIAGFSSMNIYLPRQKLSVVVLSNVRDPKTTGGLAKALLAATSGASLTAEFF